MGKYVYTRGDKQYLVCGESFYYGEYDWVLHRDEIYEVGKEKEELSEALKYEIAQEVKNELEGQGSKIDIAPPIFEIYDRTDKEV